MKKLIILLVFSSLALTQAMAQSQPYHVVFDITSRDTLVHKAIIRWVTEISKGDPSAKLEVVFYGKSLDLITQSKSGYANQVGEILKNRNVSFKVCAIAMKNNNVEKSQLLPGIEIVPDGIKEIINKQHEGWGYIKASL